MAAGQPSDVKNAAGEESAAKRVKPRFRITAFFKKSHHDQSERNVLCEIAVGAYGSAQRMHLPVAEAHAVFPAEPDDAPGQAEVEDCERGCIERCDCHGASWFVWHIC